ncbi:MAG: ribosomal-processing cysteine protease Prp [Spirochaetaceae bacterium]|nr:ribosomal-processing cysteine protease Prp [Spirochaetaceae bacterium]
MIAVAASFDEWDVLVRCEANGHAGMAKSGNDIVCAAVSVLLRGMARAVTGKNGIFAEISAPKRGSFLFQATYKEEGRDFLFAAGIFLFEGLKSVAEEFPEYCSVTVKHLKKK